MKSPRPESPKVIAHTGRVHVWQPKAYLGEVAALFKLRLTLMVVMSAVLGYLMAAQAGAFSWSGMAILALAGTLITGASNAFNQALEVESDRIMSRTCDRPLVQGRIGIPEALIIATVAGAVGILLLYIVFNSLAALLGAMALVAYAGIYTPLKKVTPWAVFVGAFPGAIPPMLGYIAVSGKFGLEPGLLFAVQFIWQFVHFWAIAWVLDDDYRKAGFLMLPSKGGRDASSAFLILLYALFVIPVSMLPWAFNLTGTVSLVIAIAASIVLLIPALQLFFSRDKAHARRLMFASFIYLPVVQLAYVLDKL